MNCFRPNAMFLAPLNVDKRTFIERLMDYFIDKVTLNGLDCHMGTCEM